MLGEEAAAADDDDVGAEGDPAPSTSSSKVMRGALLMLEMRHKFKKESVPELKTN